MAVLSLPACAPVAAALPYALVSVAENWIWFAGGMAIALFGALPLLRSREKAWAWGALWIAASVITFMAGWMGEAAHGILDAIGIIWFVALFSAAFRSGIQDAFFGFVSRYTLAFWLIAPLGLKLLAAALAAAGIAADAALWLWTPVALLVCFGLPVLVSVALESMGKAAAVLYPARYLPPVPALIEKKGVN